MSSPTCHLGTSQDSNRYPGTLSIRGLECLGQPATCGHPRVIMVSSDTKDSRIGVSRPTCHLGTSQDSNGYPGTLKYSRIGVSRLTCHLWTSQGSNGYPGILSVRGLECLG